MMVRSAARADALSMKGGRWSVEERELGAAEWWRQKVASVDAGCGGRTACPRWSDGAGGDGASIASSQGGQSRLHLAAAIEGGSKPPGSVFSAADANFMASETSNGAGALSSTMRTWDFRGGPRALQAGHEARGRGARLRYYYAGLRIQVALDARGCVDAEASARWD